MDCMIFNVRCLDLFACVNTRELAPFLSHYIRRTSRPLVVSVIRRTSRPSVISVIRRISRPLPGSLSHPKDFSAVGNLRSVIRRTSRPALPGSLSHPKDFSAAVLTRFISSFFCIYVVVWDIYLWIISPIIGNVQEGVTC